MTRITRRPENRLAKAIFAPGGKSIAQALDDAQERLDEIRGEALGDLRLKLDEIQTLGRRCQTAPAPETLQAIYALSDDVLDIAGPYGLPDLCLAVLSLCELLDKLSARRVWNWPAVQVHLHGLVLLAHPEKTSAQARQAVVEGLRQVSERIGR